MAVVAAVVVAAVAAVVAADERAQLVEELTLEIEFSDHVRLNHIPIACDRNMA